MNKHHDNFDESCYSNLISDAIKKAYKRFLKRKKKAAHGAKLNYFKSLKNQCADEIKSLNMNEKSFKAYENVDYNYGSVYFDKLK